MTMKNSTIEVTKDGRIISHFTKTPRELSQQTVFKGYKAVVIQRNNKQKSYFVHRLVAEKYVPNPNNKPEVNHLDGNKLNNNDWNLEWSTRLENVHHAVRNGLMCKGETHGRSKLTEKEVLEIRKKKMNGRELAKLYNVSPALISLIINRKKWAHI